MSAFCQHCRGAGGVTLTLLPRPLEHDTIRPAASPALLQRAPRLRDGEGALRIELSLRFRRLAPRLRARAEQLTSGRTDDCALTWCR